MGTLTEPCWLRVARTLVGIREVPGPGSNPVILQWVRDLEAPAWFDDDDKAWCAVLVNRVLLACGLPRAGTGYDLFRAKAFEAYGQALAGPAVGAILVFTRSGGGHVGFYVGERADAYRVLGGNQSNAVNETWIAKARLSGLRWPPGVALPTLGAVAAAGGEAVSSNER